MAAVAVAPATMVSGRSSLSRCYFWPLQARRLLHPLEFPSFSLSEKTYIDFCPQIRKFRPETSLSCSVFSVSGAVRVCHSESESLKRGGVVCEAAPAAGGVTDKNVVEAVKIVLEMVFRFFFVEIQRKDLFFVEIQGKDLRVSLMGHDIPKILSLSHLLSFTFSILSL